MLVAVNWTIKTAKKKKKIQPQSCRAGASCADMSNCGLFLAPLLLACAGCMAGAELSLPPTKSQCSLPVF